MATRNKKKWEDMSRREKALGLIILTVIVLLVLSIIGTILGNAKNSKNSTTANQKSQPATAETKPKEKAATAQTDQATKPQTQSEAGLAAQVETAYLKQIGYNSIAELNLDKSEVVGSPEKEITGFEDESSDVVKVNVQDNLTQAQAKQIGMDVMVGASDVKNLKWIDVRGINGTYAEVSRQDAGLAN